MTIGYNPGIVTDGLVLCLDAGNIKSFSPNVFPKPTDIYAWVNSSTGNASTLSRDTISSPVGITPFKMAITGNDPHTPTYNTSTWNIAPTVAGDTWTISVYIKASVATTCELWLAEANSSGGYLQGVVGAYSNPSLTTEWQRFTVSGTVGNASAAFLQWRFDGTNSGGTGINIWLDGIQIEKGLTSTTFNPFYNQNGTGFNDISSTLTIAESVNYPVYDTTSGISSFVFNGATNYRLFRIANSTALDTNNPSIEVWVKPSTLNQNGFWFEKGTVNSQYSFFQEGTNLCFRTKPSGTYDSLYGASSALNSSTWNQVVAVKTIDEKIIYVNGVRVYSKSYTDLITTTTGGVSIGAYGGYSGGRSYYYSGNLSNVKIYNRALSASEVMGNFNALRGRYGI